MKSARAVACLLIAVSAAARADLVSSYFNATLETGSLSGTRFAVSFSYDSSQVTPTGDSFITLTSLNFTLLGVPFTRHDIFQGGQVIFRDGVLSNVTASFQVILPPSSPVKNITFGFGGPGVIGYIGLDGGYGTGSFVFAAAPSIGSVVNAFGGVPVIAPNTWVAIHGSSLAPAGDSRAWRISDFANNKMPAQLDGVSATVNGGNAYLYSISPNQVNILTPPDLAPSLAQVQIMNNGVASNFMSVSSQPLSPSFFVFVVNGKQYVYGRHLDGTLIGPRAMLPGLTSTPAKPGEPVVLAGNGFGPTSSPISSGSISQTGTLPTLPQITVGGVAAAVSFAGLVSPGDFQINVVVPPTVSDGDQQITAMYNQSTTQPGALISIQH